ncbi:endonuclease/exonuclease/phosphatase family protein [Paraferrimonas sp. SM1919]|uniref:endonuclease/exonuclease/phosphatase family protein n=1 Tax=Paraferrimonas sp. SM1919 TaxID=2662263 RepID=UPI001F09CE36|nr:endonuclease/exonuclease/phosphatase family protein [Paraferrimonas sp. SM1919]
MTQTQPQITQVKIATFNVSMEATNYLKNNKAVYSAKTLTNALNSGEFEQINNIAEIIQRVRPDILLLNEFDYVANPQAGIELFKTKYLGISQQGQAPIEYPYVYIAPVNTGVKTGLKGEGVRLSHYGFGRYPGQYGMVLLSKYPIDTDNIRTFQKFLWKDMPNNLMPVEKDGSAWYSDREINIMRLSSKSHWDIPIQVCGQNLHVLASHPTPPVFDGEEDRNGRRNHDEIRFWADYINADVNSYHVDDSGVKGGYKAKAPFVIMGDQNASPYEGDGVPGAIAQLLEHPKVTKSALPGSAGGKQNKPNNQYAGNHTAAWGMQADYVLPSADVSVTNSGVFWPTVDSAEARLVKDRFASSDHRLVWVDVELGVNCR